jgi:hypothetical protein
LRYFWRNGIMKYLGIYKLCDVWCYVYWLLLFWAT